MQSKNDCNRFFNAFGCGQSAVDLDRLDALLDGGQDF